MTKVRRIFDIAKELNISHIEIINFLSEKDIKVTLMSAIPNDQYSDILENFQQEKNQVDRLRKEKARLNVIHHNQEQHVNLHAQMECENLRDNCPHTMPNLNRLNIPYVDSNRVQNCRFPAILRARLPQR